MRPIEVTNVISTGCYITDLEARCHWRQLENSGPAASDGCRALATGQTPENDGRCFTSGNGSLRGTVEANATYTRVGAIANDPELPLLSTIGARAPEPSEPNSHSERYHVHCTDDMRSLRVPHVTQTAPGASMSNLNTPSEVVEDPEVHTLHSGCHHHDEPQIGDIGSDDDYAPSLNSQRQPSEEPGHFSDVEIPRSWASSTEIPDREQEPSRVRTQTAKSKRAALKISSLNMNGYGAPSIYNQANKWQHMNQVMRDKRIGILLLQETHLTNERVDKIHTLVNRRLQILASYDPENPTGRAGVAFVISKQFVQTQDIAPPVEIIPGRALLLKLKIGDKVMKILNIYAPNTGSENENFLKDLHAYFEHNPTLKPDVVAGDFNIVEEAIDRLPMQMTEHKGARRSLDNLKDQMGLSDGWRATYPTLK